MQKYKYLCTEMQHVPRPKDIRPTDEGRTSDNRRTYVLQLKDMLCFSKGMLNLREQKTYIYSRIWLHNMT